MPISKDEIRDLAKRRLGLSLFESTHDDLIGLYVDEIEQRILNYCSVTSVPDGLKYPWAAMVASAAGEEQALILYPPDPDTETFEIVVGDTSVKPAKPTAPAVPGLAVDPVVFDYRGDLNAYRRMRW